MESKTLIGRIGVVKFVFIVAVAVFLSRCKTGNDKISPETWLDTSGFHSEDSIILEFPEPILLEYTLKDNEELSQARLFISKTSSRSNNLCVLEDDFSYLSFSEHTGKESTHSILINLPDSVKGTYLVEFDVFDDSGNVEESSIILEVNNPSLPVINEILSPSLSSCTLTVDSLLSNITLDLNLSCEDGIESTEFFWVEDGVQLGFQFFTTNNLMEVQGALFINIPIEISENTVLRMKVFSSIGKTTWSEFTVLMNE